jgi:hypothetical protein
MQKPSVTPFLKLRLLTVLGALFALVGCTGTFEERPPTLLVVGFGAEGSGEVGLIDTRLFDAGVPPEERVVTVRRALVDRSQPLAFDVVDRTGDRSELVVLSRRGENYYLSFFNLRDIDPDDPAAFAENTARRVDLSALGSEEPLCPRALQISRTGRYAALLNDNQRAGCAASPALSIVDLQQQAVTNVSVPGQPIIRTAFHLAQEADALYFLSEQAGDAVLRRLEVSAPASPSEGFAIPLPSGQREVRDLAPVRDALVVLRNSTFVAVRDFERDASLDDVDLEGGRSTVTNAQHLVADDFRILPNVMILSGSQFAVHLTVSDDDESTTSLSSAVGGTVDFNQFAFLLAPQRVHVFDPLEFDGSGAPRVTAFTFDALQQPAFITWTLAAPENPPTP